VLFHPHGLNATLVTFKNNQALPVNVLSASQPLDRLDVQPVSSIFSSKQKPRQRGQPTRHRKRSTVAKTSGESANGEREGRRLKLPGVVNNMFSGPSKAEREFMERVRAREMKPVRGGQT